MVLGRLSSVGPLKVGLILVISVGVVVGGAFAVGVIGTPSVVGIDNSFGTVTEDVTEIETELLIHNPNPFGASLGGLTIDYEIRMNGIRMAQGVREGVSVASGNSTVPFTTEMKNEKLPAWWVTHLRNDEATTLTVHADIHSSVVNRSFEAPAVERSINTTLIEAFDSNETREINADSPILSDPVLVVRETRGQWGTVTEEQTEIGMEFVVYNPREYPVTLTEIGYDVAMNDVRMGAGASEREYVIPPGSERTIEATFYFDNANLNEWWVSHLQNGQETTLTADFYLRIDLSDVGGDRVRVPLDTMNRTIETNIFGQKGESESDSGRSTEDTDSSTSTPESGTTETETATETETQTETDTETETETEDDGILYMHAGGGLDQPGD